MRIDETRLQVLKSDKAPSALHWMWVRVAGPKPVARHVQPLAAHVVQASVQVKAEELRLTRPETSVAVRIDRKGTDGCHALAYDPFDRAARTWRRISGSGWS